MNIPLIDGSTVDQDCGTKATALARVSALGLQVPRFVCVTASCFETLGQELGLPPLLTHLSSPSYNPNPICLFDQVDPTSVIKISSPFDDQIARSSAVMSKSASSGAFASVVSGAFRSVRTNGGFSLEQAVWSVWRSAYEEKPYRQLCALEAGGWVSSLGVIVQESVTPKISGVAHLQDGTISVSWVQGHLEAIVDGSVPGTQVSFTQSEEGHVIISGGETSVYDTVHTEIASIADSLYKDFDCIETAWACPVEVEWAIDDTGLIILQAQRLIQAIG